ncbi:MAG: histidine kinase [Alcanivorax sp.]|nr:histidine kinase [Alcanivorax sp.]
MKNHFDWMMALPPRKLFLLLSGLALLVTIMCFAVVATTPTLGLTLEKTDAAVGIRVSDVAASGPNAGRIAPGTVLVAMSTAKGDIPLRPDILIEDPDLLDYEAYNRFLADQQLLRRALNQDRVTMVADDGQRIVLETSLPLWTPAMTYAVIYAFYGWVGLLVVLGIWVYRPADIATRLFALSGVALFLTILTLATYGGRELALYGSTTAFLMSVNHIAVLMVAATLATLFWVYPRRLGPQPAPTIAVGLAVLAWLADQFQIGPGPQYTIYGVILLGFVCGVTVMGCQWRATRGRPLDRAALKWCVLSIFVGTFLLFALIMLPPAVGGTRLVPMAISLSSVLVLYLGLAAGLRRYRLFHLERWWFGTWQWFLGGVLVLVLDGVLVFVIGMAGAYALLLSLAIAGWIYFPLRVWLMGLLGRREPATLENSLPQLVNNLFTADSEAKIHAAWPGLLRSTFRPLHMTQRPAVDAAPDVAASEDGARLHVKALRPGKADTVLEYPDEGGRLFTRNDLRTAALLRGLTDKAINAVQAREQGADAERQRIARDLHDDVGGRILSLLRNAPDAHQEQLARNALQSLREALQALDQSADCRISDCLEDWQADCQARCQEMGVRLEWQQKVRANGATMSVRQSINIGRIFAEGLTNAFRHARPKVIAITLSGDPAELSIVMENDGVGDCEAEQHVLAGRGLHHMRTRAEELGGVFAFHLAGRSARLTASVPLSGDSPPAAAVQ